MDIKQVRNTLILLLAAFIWGTAFVAQSVGAQHVETFTFLACRSWLSAIALVPVTRAVDRIRRKRGMQSEKPQTASERKLLFTGGILCGLCLFAATTAQQIGIATTSTAKAGFITTMYVLMVPVISLFLGKKMGKKIWLCVVLGVIGLYLLCMVDSLTLSRGDAFVLLCALFFSGHILVIDYFSPRMDGVRLSCIQFFVAAILSTICMFVFENPQWEAIKTVGFAIIYSGLLSGAAGYTLQIIGQNGLNPAIASLAMCLESVFSALAGWIILGQTLSPREIGGCCLMFVAIVVAQLPDRIKKQARPLN